MYSSNHYNNNNNNNNNNSSRSSGRNHTTRSHTHHRSRSSSDPFSDPILVPSTREPPPPPPKPSRQPRTHSDSRDPKRTMLENAVREAVVVRGGSDQPPRNRMGRSQTGGVPPSASGSKHTAPPTRRSYSQDSASQQVMEKSRSKSGGSKVAKKGSSHADVIDRLDFTSNAIFHHDSPFDACAPSRNRHTSKAPMAAWSKPEEEAPMSAAQLRADRRLAAVDRLGGVSNDSPYPRVAYNDFEDYNKPKSAKQVDLIAEAWGIHEPEPYEEFFGGGGGAIGDHSAASSIRGGYENHSQNVNNNNNNNTNVNTNGRSRGYGLRETYSSDAPPVRKPTGRLPPPQPLNLPGSSRPASLDAPGGLPSPPLSGSPGAPKRSKSLMQKFRKMRDQPNVPVDAVMQGGDEPSPPSSIENYTEGPRSGRPTHRQQNSFFGRFGGRNNSNGPVSPTESSEHYVYVERSTQNKALPPPPRPIDTPTSPYGNDKDGYFEGPGSPGTGLGRKTSLLKRVKGVVRGGATK